MTASGGKNRQAVLGAIRASLGRGPLSGDARRELDGRIRRHERNLVPARSQVPREAQIDLFVEQAEAVSCTVERLDSVEDVPQALAEFLRRHNLPLKAVLAPDDWLGGLPWEREPLLELRRGPAENEDLVSLTPAFAGVAETGTLLATSGAAHPTTLNFMPDYHVVALRTSQVVGAYEDAWDRLRAAHPDGERFAMPRTVNMITGPSRTGDIELTIHLGAHGPRSLHILLIDDEKAAG